MILAAQTKKTREGEGINLIVHTFSGPMFGIVGVVKVVGSIKLTNHLIVLGLAEAEQSKEAHRAQITLKLLEFWLWMIHINGLHLNHWRFILLGILEKHHMMIEIKVKRMPKTGLKTNVLRLIIEGLGPLLSKLSPYADSQSSNVADILVHEKE